MNVTISFDIDKLSAGNVAVTPQSIDWDVMLDPEEDRANYWESFTHTDDNGRDWTMVSSGGSVVAGIFIDGRLYTQEEYDTYEEHHEADAIELWEWNDLFQFDAFENVSGPVMSYWYALPEAEDNPADYAARIGGSLCVVEVDGSYGVALTGGGMDLTWEIVTAYVAVGCLPPAHFAADLPAMADRGRSAEDKALIGACLRSLTVQAARASAAITRLHERFND